MNPIFPPDPPQEDTAFYVDIGPFFDRFGASQLEVLKTEDPDLKAFIDSMRSRKWIYTKHPMVAMGIDRAITLGIPGVDEALKETIVATPARWSEQSALIKVYFPEQEALARQRK